MGSEAGVEGFDLRNTATPHSGVHSGFILPKVRHPILYLYCSIKRLDYYMNMCQRYCFLRRSVSGAMTLSGRTQSARSGTTVRPGDGGLAGWCASGRPPHSDASRELAARARSLASRGGPRRGCLYRRRERPRGAGRRPCWKSLAYDGAWGQVRRPHLWWRPTGYESCTRGWQNVSKSNNCNFCNFCATFEDPGFILFPSARRAVRERSHPNLRLSRVCFQVELLQLLQISANRVLHKQLIEMTAENEFLHYCNSCRSLAR